MLRKNIFKIVCFALVVCVGVSFLFFNNGTAKADVSSINLNDFQSYYEEINKYDTQSLPTVSESAYCLRDDYIIFTQQQSPYGLCWAYSGNTVLATTLMMATKEYYDFSEGWVSVVYNYLSNKNPDLMDYINRDPNGNNDEYYIGGGAFFEMLDYVSRRAGVVLESDFTASEFQAVCNQNINKVYDMYSSYAVDSIMDKVEPYTFNNYIEPENASYAEIIKNQIKYHIKNHGAVCASMDWYTDENDDGTATQNGITYKRDVTSPNGGHAITLIGWDNNITINGSKGAWVALNSWGDDFGNDGVFYVSYNDEDFNNFAGYKYIDETDDLYLNTHVNKQETTASYSYKKAGAYTGSFNAVSKTSLTKNVFYKNQVSKIAITYDYSISEDTAILGDKPTIYYYDADVTNDFDIIVDFVNCKLSITPLKNIPTGTYKVITNCRNTKTLELEQYINVFYVMDGTEINYVRNFAGYFNEQPSGNLIIYNFVETNDYGNIKNNGNYVVVNDYNYDNSKLILATTKNSGTILIEIYANSYGDINSITTNSSLVNAFDPHGYYPFEIKYDLSKETNYSFEIKTASNASKTFDVEILKATSTDKMINVVYDTNGGINNEQNQSRVLLSTSKPAKIYAPTTNKVGETFAGWFKDKTCVSSPLTKTGEYWSLGYTSDMFINSPTVDASCESEYNKYIKNCAYVHLYAKWEKTQYSFNYYMEENSTNLYLTQNYGYGDIIQMPASPEKTGYIFSGWVTKQGEEFDFNETVSKNIDLYATWEIKKFTVKIIDDQNPQNNNTEKDILNVEYNTTILKPTISLKGYSVEWYTNSARTNLWNFEDKVKTDDLKLYAKWSLNDITTPTISYQTSELTVKNDIRITVKFSHEISVKNEDISVKWYRNSNLITTTTTINNYQDNNGIFDYELSINENLEDAGNYVYCAEIIFSDGNLKTELKKTDDLELSVLEKSIGVSNINYANNLLTWQDTNPENATYIVYVYTTDSEEVIGETKKSNCDGSAVNQKLIDVWNMAEIKKSAGEYYFKIEKYVDDICVGEVKSKKYNIYSVLYDGIIKDLSTLFEPILYDKGSKLVKPTNWGIENRADYNFVGWFTQKDGEYDKEWNFNEDVVSGNLTLYAKWEIQKNIDLTAECIHNNKNIIVDSCINQTYEYNTSYNVNIVAEHEIYEILDDEDKVNCKFEYKWYIKNGETWDEIELAEGEVYTNSISVGFVKDSGDYKCEVKFTDIYGFSIKNSIEFSVKIEKAETIINHASVVKSYTYTGSWIVVDSGAELTRKDELSPIVYRNNKFIDVPNGGIQTVTLYVEETDNYKSATVEFDVTVNKETVSFNEYETPKIQEFEYNGESPVIQYKLNRGNVNLKVTAYYELDGQQMPIVDAGEYRNVILIIEETNNYKAKENYIIDKVIIKRKDITIKVNDITSFWLFDLKKPTISLVSGDIEDLANIDITYICDADKYQIGTFDIKGVASAKNYNVTIINGKYNVNGIPYFIAGAILLILIIWLIALRGKRVYSIDFVENGGTPVVPIETKKKRRIVLSTPTRQGYNFLGWYFDDSLDKPYNGKIKKGRHYILHAKWRKLEGEEAYTKDEKIDKILRDLNIRKNQTQNVTTNISASNNFEQSKQPEEKVQDERSQQDIMNEIISKATTTKVSSSNEDLDNFINNLTNKK